jgi:hypothetical protein
LLGALGGLQSLHGPVELLHLLQHRGGDLAGLDSLRDRHELVEVLGAPLLHLLAPLRVGQLRKYR